MAGKALGHDPLAGLGTPGERARGQAGVVLAMRRDPDRGETKPPPPRRKRASGGGGAGGRDGDNALDRRLAAIERGVDRALASIHEEVGGPGASGDAGARLARQVRDLDAKLDEVADATARFARRRRRGLFGHARSLAKTAGTLVSPDYYTRKLGEFGLRDRSSQVDEFGMDPVYRARLLPLFEFLFSRWWRVRIEGLDHVPERGPALLVGNHGGVIPFDAAMVSHAIESRHPAKRRARFMIEDWFATLPFASPLLARAGAARAHRENAERLLRRGHLIGVFPEGTKGSLKFYKDRYKVQRFGRGGSVRLALRTGAPIIPFAVVGSEEIYPVIAKVNWLARAIGIDELPIPVNVLLGPLGLVPLPSKWQIRFGEPIDLRGRDPSDADNDLLVNQLIEDLRRRVQALVDESLVRRKSVWRG